ncbi:MAG: chain-length determining protein [Bacteroidaceae bacterium]|nr:chain-length determining protein [Bacteroidaceae bacterium]
MDNQKQYIEPKKGEEESHIDFKAMFDAFKKRKNLYWKVLPVVFVLACIYTLSLPNYYTCEVQLAPELSTSRSTNSLSVLANQFGLRMGSGTMGSEALYPILYPDVVNSTDFKISLFNIPVHKKDSTRTMTYYDYLMNDQKVPWWTSVIGVAMEGVASIFSTEEKTIEEKKIDPFQLTKQQTNIAKFLEKKVICDVDNKTLVISIEVIDQDPLICATIADSVQTRLQEFITDYRTQKARVDVEYNQKLTADAKVLYDEARKKYAAYADAHQDIIYQSDRTKLMDLENDMQLKYNAYNAMAQRLLLAETKVQEETPSFTTLQRATVPVKKSGPARSKMVLIALFLAFIGTSIWILYKEDQLKLLLGLS